MKTLQEFRSWLAAAIIRNNNNANNTAWFLYAVNMFNLVEDNNTQFPMAMGFNRAYRIPEITINFKVINELGWKEDEIFFVVCHEIYHFLQLCTSRKGLRNGEKWNIALDAVVNTQLIKDFQYNNGTIKPKAPEKGIYLKPEEIPAPENFYSEWVYDNLPKKLEEFCNGVKSGKYIFFDDHDSMGGFEEIDEEELEHIVMDRIERLNQSMGHTPGSIEAYLKRMRESRVCWQAILRRFVGNNIKIGSYSSWKRPSRRFGQKQPGRLVERSGTAVFIIDESGSMPDEELDQAWAEIEKVSQTFAVTIIHCDAKVHHVEKYTKTTKAKSHGRGGTDMNPALEVANTINPSFICCVTDGYIPIPIATKRPCLFVITSTGSTSAVKDRMHVQITKE